MNNWYQNLDDNLIRECGIQRRIKTQRGKIRKSWKEFMIMLVYSLNNKNKYLMAKVDFLNQALSFVRKLHFSTSW